MADDKIWKPLNLVKVTAEYLAEKNIPGARLDAEILLCHVMGLKRRVDLYAGFETEISGKNLALYRDAVRRRAAREPVSRIVGHREFMSLNFMVTPDVLSPRPETELLVEAALELANPKKRAAREEEPTREEEENSARNAAASAALERILDRYAENVEDEDGLNEDTGTESPEPPGGIAGAPGAGKTATAPARERKAKRPQKPEVAEETAGRPVRVLDLGTGSGCIAVSVAAHCPAARVVAVDASPGALSVAKKNAASAGMAERVEFRQGDWFAACRQGETFDLILSNPPYLVEGDPEIWPEVRDYDPPRALYGGRDGLDCYRRVLPDAGMWLAPGGWIFLEVGSGQAAPVRDMLSRRGFRQAGIIKDYAGTERVVKARAE